MGLEFVILAQIAAFLAASAGTIVAISAPKSEEPIFARSVRQRYVDRMGR